MTGIAVAVVAPLALIGAPMQTAPDTTGAYYMDARSAADWMIVNDGVMGGLSSSEFVDSGDGHATFRGVLSLDNNGGFASVRGLVQPGAMEGREALELRVRGDGRTYQIRLRTDRRFDGIAYKAEFVTIDGEWTTIVVPFSDFEATWRGRTPRGAPPLDPAAVRQIGFLIGDKVEGPFRLDVEWVRTAE